MSTRMQNRALSEQESLKPAQGRDQVGRVGAMLGTREIRSLRLRSLLLTEGAAGGPVGVASHFLAMQAQDFPSSRWALGVRSGATQAQVEQAFNDRQIVRSWPLRGTLHAVPAADLTWLLRVKAMQRATSAKRWRERLGLSQDHIETVRIGVIETLAGDRRLGRDALIEAVAGRGIRIEKHWKYHLLWVLAQTGTIVFGPVAAGQQLIALTDEWLAHTRQSEPEDPLAELAARYVAAHGPATVADLAWWAGLGKREAAQALESAGDRVTKVEDEHGQPLWMSPEVADRKPASGTILLPAYDEHLLGYQDRDAMLNPAHNAAWCPGGNGVFRPTVVSDGKCVGVWKPAAQAQLRRLRPDHPVPITIEWFDGVKPPDPDSLAAAANQYARFHGRETARVKFEKS